LVFVSISILRALVVTVCDAYGLGSNHRAKPIVQTFGDRQGMMIALQQRHSAC